VVSAADPHGLISRISRLELLLVLPSSSSIVLTRLSGPLDLLPGSLTIRPQRRLLLVCNTVNEIDVEMWHHGRIIFEFLFGFLLLLIIPSLPLEVHINPL
jgi:hypothetical protein